MQSNDASYNQMNTTNGSNQGMTSPPQQQQQYNQPPQQQQYYQPPMPQQQQSQAPQFLVVQQESQGWKCHACQSGGFVDETSCCGCHCLLWCIFVPFGICIYPCCCKSAHGKTRKCLNCQTKVTISDGRCCN
ncbi:hypothetical protein PPERSA_03592 [Pseudocohnilembus persalinus]|uniref:Uncharacterized protein n=1 Tax=Pseudocohnilembus persalinus TaxID=266149 RepID=A0A0V0QQR6_PSEPJ|nr:hypothetical protein PPERSA_03592 [Pseudocohnilembus persalinus]|eukprot:KRX04352.1 hypothetical protein PPERSA_03592 [Pseudocohnilembus persalinus]